MIQWSGTMLVHQIETAVILLLTLVYLLYSVSLQLYFVYFDTSHCLRAVTETLEELSFVENETQVSELTRCTSVAQFVLMLLY